MNSLRTEIKTYHSNGDINEHYYIVNGGIEGLYRRYVSNGILSSVINYKNGSMDGYGIYHCDEPIIEYVKKGVLIYRLNFNETFDLHKFIKTERGYTQYILTRIKGTLSIFGDIHRYYSGSFCFTVIRLLRKFKH